MGVNCCPHLPEYAYKDLFSKIYMFISKVELFLLNEEN